MIKNGIVMAAKRMCKTYIQHVGFINLKVQSCRLYNHKCIMASTQITSTEISRLQLV